MTKPSPTKKTAPRRRTTTRKPKAAPAAQAKVEMFDGAPPASVKQSPAAAAPEPTSKATADEKPEAGGGQAIAPVRPAATQASSDEPEQVMLGQVIGLLHRVPMASVQASLSHDMAQVIERLRSERSVMDLHGRMRAADGRCAPAIFTVDLAGDGLNLFDGAAGIAAAMNIGADHCFVITIANGDAGAAQSYLAERSAKSPASSEDEDLPYRAYASGNV